jgi:hypothetical protein
MKRTLVFMFMLIEFALVLASFNQGLPSWMEDYYGLLVLIFIFCNMLVLISAR